MKCQPRANNNRKTVVVCALVYICIYIQCVPVIASRILHEICLLLGELSIRGTKLTLNARLGTKTNLLKSNIAIRRTPLYILYCVLIV